MTARSFNLIHAYVRGEKGTMEAITERLAHTGREVAFISVERELSVRLGEISVLLCGIAPQLDWSAATRMRLLQMMGSGVDPLLPARGLPERVAIANAKGIHGSEIRDHVLALMLAFERGLPRLHDQQRRHQWHAFPLGTLSGKTVGILGVGAIGQSVAAVCAALGMKVIGTRLDARPTPSVSEIYPPEQLGTVLGRSDYVVVTLPLTSRTRRILGRDELALLRPRAVLIHLSRGGIVDQTALVDALRAGMLAGAALDVFDEEPLPAHSALWDTPNLVITPHVGGHVVDYLERALDVLVENLECLERGESPRNLVDRERGY